MSLSRLRLKRFVIVAEMLECSNCEVFVGPNGSCNYVCNDGRAHWTNRTQAVSRWGLLRVDKRGKRRFSLCSTKIFVLQLANLKDGTLFHPRRNEQS